jgi:hypothetical protein
MRNLGCDKILVDILLVRMVFSEEIIGSFIWKKAVEIKENTYKEWCLEFFSTVKVKKEIADEELFAEGIMKFRLGGTKHTVTLLELGRLLGVYSEEEVGIENFKKLIVKGERKKKNFDGDKYWEEISGENVKVFGKKRVWKIRNPMLQVIHKILVKSVFHRNHYEQYVLDDDLWILHMFDKHQSISHVNLVWFMAQYPGKEAIAAGGTRICGGHLVTRIAKGLGLMNEGEMALFSRHVRPGNVNMRSFAYLRDKESGKLRDLPEVLEFEPLYEW